MPRYFFHLRYGAEVVRDDLGDELADDQAALQRGVDTARALLRAAPEKVETWSHCVLEIAGSDGEPVWRLPILDAVQAAGDHKFKA